MKKNIFYRIARKIYRTFFKKKDVKEQYKSLDKEDFYNKISKYDLISFDIFDTLVTRTLYEPDDLFRIMADKLGISDFLDRRKKAEQEAISKFNHDVNLSEIYECYKELNHISKKEVDSIKNLEISLEILFIVPRVEMKEVFDRLIKDKKHVVLTSDMYLEKDTILKMLKKCGYEKYDEFYLSNELDARKDNKKIWKHLDLSKKIVHIGDNRVSDFEYPKEFGVDTIKIESSKELFKRTDLFLRMNSLIENRSMSDSIFLGLIINKNLFNSPFSNLKVNDLSTFATAFYAPMVLEFIKYIDNSSKKDDNLLFLAREGYYLQDLYKYYVGKTKKKEVNNLYFLASRKSTILPSIFKESDFEFILNNDYNGNIKTYFEKNLELDYNDDDFEIELPKDKLKVLEVLKKYKKDILEQSSKQRDNYIKYVKNCIKNYEKKNLVLVDLGYSGTIQYNLSKMLNKELSGLYLTNSSNVKKYKKNKLNFLFDNTSSDYSSIYHYSLILEYFFTAPFGQLQKFDLDGDDVVPIFNNESLDDDRVKNIDLIKKQIIDYIDLYLEINNQYSLNINKDIMYSLYCGLVECNMISYDVKDKFNYFDAFSREEEKNIFKTLNKY